MPISKYLSKGVRRALAKRKHSKAAKAMAKPMPKAKKSPMATTKAKKSKPVMTQKERSEKFRSSSSRLRGATKVAEKKTPATKVNIEALRRENRALKRALKKFLDKKDAMPGKMGAAIKRKAAETTPLGTPPRNRAPKKNRATTPSKRRLRNRGIQSRRRSYTR